MDLAWTERRLVVEHEGAYHVDGLHIVRDDGRYQRSEAAGWRVIRVAGHDLRDPDVVVRGTRFAHQAP